jgi:hypothetical protein
MSGSRRTYVNGGGPVPGPVSGFPPLLALGTTGTQVTLQGSHANLTVNGTIIVDSTASPAVSVNNNNSAFTYTSLQILSPGTCSGCNGGYTGRMDAVSDPLVNLAMPDESGMSVFTDGNPAHGQGVYRTVPITFPNNQTTVLASGIYIAEAGFSFPSKAVVNGTAGVLLFNGCGLHAPGGCANTGPFSVAGQTSINLNPPTSGPYSASALGNKGLVLWQPLANTSPINISGNGSISSSFAGVIYAPGATSITLGAGNAGLSIGAVIGKSYTISGSGNSGTVTIGP